MSRNPRLSASRFASFAEPLERRLMLAAGDLDPSFSGDGIASIDVGGGDAPVDVAVQADGKTVVIGQGGGVSGAADFLLARFNFDGSPDTSFGPNGNGRVATSIADRSGGLRAVALQGDGKIVVVGFSFTGPTAPLEFTVLRYLPNGTLDDSFDGNGIKAFGFGEHSSAQAVGIDAAGRIVVGGRVGFSGAEGDDFALARLNPDGSFDSSFDGNGTTTINFRAAERFGGLAFDSGGKIVAIGTSTTGEPAARVAVARLNSDGSLDTTFDNDGRKLIESPTKQIARGNAVLVQSGGKIVVAGEENNVNQPRDFFLARLLPTGQLDTTFGELGTGWRPTNFGLNSDDAGQDMIRSAAGGLIVAGTSQGHLAFAGYTADGRLDLSFGTNGLEVTERAELSGGFGTVFGSVAKGLGRRFTATGPRDFTTARFLDSGANLVTAGAIDSLALEGTTNTASLFVGRTERLPFATRVFFSVGGTATFGNTRGGARDWNMPGLVIPPLGSPFVDIPANETFVLLTFTTINDTTREGNESAIFTILSNSNYEIGTPGAGTITIQDDDTPNSRIGTTTATLPPKHIGVGQELQAAVTWTVPTGGWRQLSSIQLRLRDLHDGDALALLTFDEGTNSFSVESIPAAGDNPVSLMLSKCIFQAAGPDAPTVTVIFTFLFNAGATNRRFAVDVAATNDTDAFSGFAQIGELHVHKKPKGDGLLLPL